MPGQSVRVSALDEIGDRDAPIGSRLWALWVVSQAKLQREELERDASLLRDLITKMQKYEAWKALGVLSFDILCAKHLRLSSDDVAAVLKARKGQTVGAVLRKVGRPKAGEGNGRDSTITGRDTAYLAARLRRDHPSAEFDEAVRGSVRQAAIAAGIVKVPTALDRLLKLWAKLTPAERKQFLEEITNQ